MRDLGPKLTFLPRRFARNATTPDITLTHMPRSQVTQKKILKIRYKQAPPATKVMIADLGAERAPIGAELSPRATPCIMLSLTVGHDWICPACRNTYAS